VEERTRALLEEHPYNRARRAAGKNEISQLWIWGGGPMPTLEPFARRFGVAGGLISAVDLLNGIARLTGLRVIAVPGATGYYDTDYAAKGAAALAALAERPFVAIHVEAPDEAGHNADAEEKVRAIENIDREILAPLLAEADRAGDLRLLVLPDHPTPISIRTHTRTPVPAALWGPGFGGAGAAGYTEPAAEAASGGPAVFAPDLMRHLVGLREGPPRP
jgi:2,3-bisphosphoglycerate-independent phosphoglycerate mutase